MTVPTFGVHTQAEIGPKSALVSSLNDGTDLNSLWDELGQLLAVWNERTTSLTSLLSFPTTNAADVVVQSISTASFEKATEFGVPKAIGPPANAILLGYSFADWDLRVSLSWMFLRGADRRQVEGVFNSILHSDNRLTTSAILNRLLDPLDYLSPEGVRTFGLYNGTDGIAPPPVAGRTFPPETSHYVRSGAPELDSGDVEAGYRALRDKGYGLGDGSQLLIIANPTQSEQVQTWQAGKPSRDVVAPETAAPLARFDFIPAKTAPPYLTPESIVGMPIEGNFHGVEVLGSYGPGWLLESPFIPEDYVIIVASSGPNSQDNVVGFRSHVLPAYQGLRQIASPGAYPLVESFSQRSFGVGVRQRGGAYVINVGDEQISGWNGYEVPTVDTGI